MNLHELIPELSTCVVVVASSRLSDSDHGEVSGT